MDGRSVWLLETLDRMHRGHLLSTQPARKLDTRVLESSYLLCTYMRYVIRLLQYIACACMYNTLFLPLQGHNRPRRAPILPHLHRDNPAVRQLLPHPA